MRKQVLIYITVFLGVFFLTDQIGGRIILRGIEKFYGLNQHAEMLIVGHSHIMLAVDKDGIEKETGLSVSKYTREGVNVFERFEMIKQYLNSPYSDSLKCILYGVDQYSFVKDGLSKQSYKQFYPFMDNRVMDEYIKCSAENTKDYLIHKYIRLSRYSDALINASIRGYRNDYSNYKIGDIDAEALKEKMNSGKLKSARKLVDDKELMSVFDETVRFVTERGIRLVLVNVPIIDFLKEYDADGSQRVISVFEAYAATNPLVEYWDFNGQYESDYSIFYDPIHLNVKGREIMSKEIARKIIYE